MRKSGRTDRVFSGRVFDVERDRVRLANGRTMTMEIVRHRGSVVLLPQPARDRIVLVRQFRYVIGRRIWELPAGTLEPGETPAHAARRECEEETGWRPGRVERLGAGYPSPGFCDELMIFYACRALVRPARPAAQDPDEELRSRVFSIRDVWTLIERGRIVDMKTIAGLTLLDQRRRLRPA